MRILITCLLFWSISGMFAQEIPEADDPKVGLVLSGGGAKGLAHIGVLKELEAAGVRVDYIGGTSMGAIVGSLYAAGYNAQQLDSIFTSLDFDTLIQDDIPRSAKTFYEKDDSETYAVTLPFDNFKLGFPSGISKGQNVYNLLSRLLVHVYDVDDFSELQIPFFCVATNVETGQEVILDKGYLPRAVTASGALPTLFSPVRINDTIFVDGGVVNNYPVEEVRARGADIIIGVDVQDSLRDRKSLRSAIDVLVQINNYRTINDMKEKRNKTDVYINPKIDDFTVVSFDEGRKIISSGTEAAQQKKAALEAIAARQLKKERDTVIFNTNTSIYITDVGIEGLQSYTRSYVLGKLKLQTPANVSYRKFNEGVNNLSATGNFDQINYRLVPDPKEPNHYSVQFDLVENESKTLLRLGVHYDDLFRSAGLVNITRKRLFTNNDVTSLDLIIGDNLRYNFEYYIDKGFYWSIGLTSAFNSFEKEVANDFILNESSLTTPIEVNELNLRYDDFTNTAFVQTLFRRSFLLSLGVEHKWLRYLSETIGTDEDDLPRTIFENTNYLSTFGKLTYDTFDNKFYPREGFYFHGDFHWYLWADGMNTAFEPFSIAKAKAAWAQPIASKLSFVLSTEGGFKWGDRRTQSLDFFVGGYGFKPLNNIIPFSGYEALSLRGDTYLLSRLVFDYEIFRKNHLLLSGNIANVGDALFERGQWIDRINYSGVAVGYALETFLGPIAIQYAYVPEENTDEFYVNVGFRF